MNAKEYHQLARVEIEGIVGSLTRRQMKVLKARAAGFENAEIAEVYGIAQKSVDTHAQNMKKRLGTSNVALQTRMYLTFTGDL